MQSLISLFLVMICTGGCIPLSTQVSEGHQYTKEEIAFLDLPKTTRGEVLSTLGEPLLEVADSGVLLYVWQTTPRFQTPTLSTKHEDAGVVKKAPIEWGLFIAYDERGYVTAHEVRKVGTVALEQNCVDWGQIQIQKRQRDLGL
jgi:hypothetical protein